MEFRVLTLGDVCAQPGIQLLRRRLWALRKETKADFVVVNGENASGTGITPAQADMLFDAGADVVTLGNHAFRRREIGQYLDDTNAILRPANFSARAPGQGMGFYDTPWGDVCVINLIGRIGMDPGTDNPFDVADRLVTRARERTSFIICDFHAEATSEKYAMAYFLDGRASVLFGTHTHVQTADERILPGGLGYITDLGMTGPEGTVIGVQPAQSIAYFRGDVMTRFEYPTDGAAVLSGALFTLDRNTGRCLGVERILEAHTGGR